jgi:cytochrome b subunit of formate dehydrogenase
MEKERKIKPYFYDERQERITARIAVFFLFLTQIALGGVILYRRYVLHQSNTEIADLNILLAASLYGFIAVRLLFSAGVPTLNMKKTLIIYAGFVLVLGTILTLIYGFPPVNRWHNTLLPVLLGPAILLLVLAMTI